MRALTHATPSSLWGSLVTCVVYCLRVRQCSGCVSLFLWKYHHDSYCTSCECEKKKRYSHIRGVRLEVLSCACVCRCRGCFLCRCVLCACDTYVQTRSCAREHTHTHPPTLTHTRAPARTLAHKNAHTRTNTRARARTHARTHTQTHPHRLTHCHRSGRETACLSI